jgi:DNA invertase Pin-like site-specific DNA recombinase
MSTDHQQYSTENQAAAIGRYAEDHRMEVVRSYADLGKSGLTLQHRDGLRQLLTDVESGTAEYTAILVYDVSRWGRFQDADESAYYEYRCRRARVAVHYCAEPFANDGSVSSTLLKTIKRTMAGEFSRELSAKVFAGKSRLVELGFRQGGTAGLGFRRLLIDRHGTPKGLLKLYDRKSLITDRVILVLGPDEEVRTVREIYDWVITDNLDFEAIARRLNGRGIANEFGRPWTRFMVQEIVTNPKYLGANVTNRRSNKLGGRYVRNPPEMWVRLDGAFPAIVDEATFQKTQDVLSARLARPSDGELLDGLQSLLKRTGSLTASVIRPQQGVRSSRVYCKRFGGLLGAYRRIGYQPRKNFEFLAVEAQIAKMRAALTVTFQEMLKISGAVVGATDDPGLFTANEGLTVRFLLVRCRDTQRGDRWFIRFRAHERADINIAGRMTSTNDAILDYYVFPRSSAPEGHFEIGLTNSVVFDVHRFENLSRIADLLREVTLEDMDHAASFD